MPPYITYVHAKANSNVIATTGIEAENALAAPVEAGAAPDEAAVPPLPPAGRLLPEEDEPEEPEEV